MITETILVEGVLGHITCKVTSPTRKFLHASITPSSLSSMQKKANRKFGVIINTIEIVASEYFSSYNNWPNTARSEIMSARYKMKPNKIAMSYLDVKVVKKDLIPHLDIV